MCWKFSREISEYQILLNKKDKKRFYTLLMKVVLARGTGFVKKTVHNLAPGIIIHF
jgi:hypothetical protein